MSAPRDPRAGAPPAAAADLTVSELVSRLGLEPLPMEGGLYRETYRSALRLPAQALPAGLGERAAATAIFYLLTPDTASAMHRLPVDELYHFLMGDPVEMLILAPGEPARPLTLGHDLRAGHALAAIVPAGAWQGSRLAAGGRWALMAVTVAPGFEFRDYEAADAEALCAAWREHAARIRALAR